MQKPSHQIYIPSTINFYICKYPLNFHTLAMLQRLLTLWHLVLFIGLPILKGQTVLEPGDLAVLGVNTNTFLCSGVSGADEVSFVCFKDLETNTTIDITDNGWERVNPGLWGDTEGVIRLTRTGGTVSSGTVITIQFLNGGYNVLSPDNNWSITDLNPPVPPLTINLNSMGDQLYFMQGGNWNNPPGNHDATYDGNILFGFNTLSVWAADGSTQQSNLHPQVTPCFHMEPTSGVTDYIKYTNPLSAATQLEWINRIRDAANWTSYSDCATYQSAPPDYAAGYVLLLNASGISVSCTICNECAPFDETLVFDLPVSGGPFDVIYSDGTNTYTLNNVNNGITAIHIITEDVDFSLVSVTDQNECPVFYNFEGEANITVIPTPDAGGDHNFYICPDAMPFNLTDSLTGTPDPGGSWSPLLNSGANVYDPALDEEGSFVYTVSGGLCPDATSTATVNFVDLSPSTIEVSCHDNGTPNDDTDDIIVITFTPMGVYLGTEYDASVSSGSVNPNSSPYDLTTIFQMQPGSAGSGDVTFTVQDNTPPFCSFNFVINDPGVCSNSCADAPEVSISGGGDICVGNCPEEPAVVSFEIIGSEEPFTLDLSASIPPFPSFDFIIPGLTLNAEINICVDGLLPNYDPGTNTLTLPETFAGLSGTITVISITDNAGCPGTVSSMNSISLNILENPGANDPDISICEDLANNYDLTQWNTIVNPTAMISWYDGDPSGSGAILSDPVNTDLTMITELWVHADDGSCTSTVQVTFNIIPVPSANDPAPNICASEAIAFDLTTLDQVVNPSAVITWFIGDPFAGGTIIPDPANTDLTLMQDIFALIVEEPCSSAIQISYFLLPVPEVNPTSLMMCSATAQSYDLSQHDTEINSSLPVTWYDGEPGQGGILIPDPVSTDLTGLSSVWALVGDGACSNYIEVPVEILQGPVIQQIFIEVCSTESEYVDLTQFSNDIHSTYPVNWYNGDPENGGLLIPEPENVDLNLLSSLWVLVDDGACIATAEIGFNISLSPELDLSEMIGICNGDSIDLNEIQITDLNGSGGQITFHNSFPPWPGNIIEPPVITPAISTTIYALATAGECTDTLPIPIQVNALPTFQILALPCDIANNTYTVVMQTNAATIVSAAGMVINNMASQDSIIEIPDGISTFLVLTSVEGCQDTITLQAPDCNCPVIPLPNPLQDTVSICKDEAIPALSVTVEDGLIANWYDQVIGGMLLLEDNTTFEPNTSITTTFYAEAVDTSNGCASPRVPVTLEVFQVPVLQMLDDPELCLGDSLDLTTFLPLVINGVAGTGQWFELPSLMPVSGNVPAIEGKEYVYFFTALEGSCQASDTIAIHTVEKPDLDVLSINCIDSSFSYGVLFVSNAENITSSSGTITQINASDSFLISGIVLNMDVTVTLSGSTIGCDTSFTIPAPDCACPPLLIDSSFVLCSDPGTIDLAVFQNGSSDGFWQFLSTPGGGGASISSASMFDGSNADGGTYLLKFTSDIPLGECPDSAFFELELVNPSFLDLPASITTCFYNDDRTIFIDGNVSGSHISLSWSHNGQGTISNPDSGNFYYYLDANDSFLDSIVVVITAEDNYQICPSETDSTIIQVNSSAFIQMYTDMLFCDTVGVFDLDQFILYGPTNGYWIHHSHTSPPITDSSFYNFTGTGPSGFSFLYVTINATPPCLNDTIIAYPVVENCSCSLLALVQNDSVSICHDDAITLSGTISGGTGNTDTYWLIGTDTIPGTELNVNQSGTYTFVVEDEADCVSSDTVIVSEYEMPELLISTVDPSCPGESDGVIVLDYIIAGQGPLFVSLNNSDFEDITALPYTFGGLSSGFHQLTVMDGFGCMEEYEIVIEEPPLLSVDLGPDLIIQKGDSVFLNPLISFIPDSFYWITNPEITLTGLSGQIISPPVDMNVNLIVFDEVGCRYTDSLKITVNKKSSVYIPNVFSPNGDNINDIFKPFVNEEFSKILSLNIFDRWGAIIFEQNDRMPDDPGLGWDGRFNGHGAPTGVFIYRLILETTNEKSVIFYGDITLVR